ncbi:MAG: carboxypeptidase regulatory-like domain-containing protein, partial [Lachnospiraceae bacterium]|nr:carboxypeptidase regulatory-like domain-containing protein [Lachnospiraceae bacterium]
MKKGMKRIIAFVLALVMTFSVQVPQKVEAASSTAVYNGGYGIEDILTYYQYFTRGDCELGNHCVGPVAVGGAIDGGLLGDASYTPSYAKRLKRAQVTGVSTYGATTHDFYYGELANDSEFNDDDHANFNGFTKNALFMDIEGAFNNSIINESKAMLNNADDLSLEVVDGVSTSRIICDFTQGSSYKKISLANYLAADELIIRLNSWDDLKTKKQVVSFYGDTQESETNFYLGGRNFTSGSDNGIIVKFQFKDANGNSVELLGGNISEQYNNAESGMFYDATTKYGNQCNLEGMKLIFNFPDADNSVKTEEFFGHIVAPSATVYNIVGHLEGGVIAKESRIEGTNAVEPHFFPFNALNGSGSEVVQSIRFGKKYVHPITKDIQNQPGNKPAEFALYTSADCSGAPIELPKLSDNPDSQGIYEGAISGSLLSKNSTYYLKEIAPAQGFLITTDVYECKIDGNGNVTYKLVGSDAGYSADMPVFTNEKKITTVKVTVKDIETGDEIEGITVNINKSGSTDVILSQPTNRDGIVEKVDVEHGWYEATAVELSTTGYRIPENNYGHTEITLDGKVDIEVPGGEIGEGVIYLEQLPDLTVTVKDEETKELISNATVVLKNEDGDEVASNTTGADGEAVVFEQLPNGKYTVEVTDAEGYIVPEEKEVTMSGENKECVVELNQQQVVSPTADLTVTVKDEETKELISNATVVLKNEADEVVDSKTTGTNGESVVFEQLANGKYTVVVTTAEGYIVPEKTDVTMSGTNNACVVELKQLPDLTVTVKDEETKELISNATVVLKNEDGDEVASNTTGADGEAVVFEQLPNGKYTVEVTDAEGYIVPEEKEVTMSGIDNACV